MLRARRLMPVLHGWASRRLGALAPLRSLQRRGAAGPTRTCAQAPAGETGVTASAAAPARAQGNTGRRHSPETRAKLSAAQHARDPVAEAERRQKIGAANRGRPPWNKGQPHHPAVRAKIAAATAAAMARPEVLAKVKAAAAARGPCSEAVRKKISDTTRRCRGRRLDPLLRRCMYPTREQLLAELQAAAAGGGQPDKAALLRLADRLIEQRSWARTVTRAATLSRFAGVERSSIAALLDEPTPWDLLLRSAELQGVLAEYQAVCLLRGVPDARPAAPAADSAPPAVSLQELAFVAVQALRALAEAHPERAAQRWRGEGWRSKVPQKEAVAALQALGVDSWQLPFRILSDAELAAAVQ